VVSHPGDVFPKGIPETLTADDLAALNDLPVLLDLRQSLPEKVTQEMGPGPGLVRFVF
jgi:hypothetical protein